MSSQAKRQKIDVSAEGGATKPNQTEVKAKGQSGAGCGSGDWDVDSYRTEYESEEHWELRRSFMLAHKNNFDEDRLVNLAQTFVNIEFLGCKYHSELMHKVAEMSKDIKAIEDYRRNRALRLKRTFVSASDAAEQRAKGGWRKYE